MRRMYSENQLRKIVQEEIAKVQPTAASVEAPVEPEPEPEVKPETKDKKSK